ncbi:hypothetical protein ACGYK1_08655 [Sulfitobacter sp. 1A13191]|uniref:hypothetical protein n=1 Tax=Sulfitobacter sp. 1A13191 TaxID=3368589 RepID=UPI0037460152
MTTRSAIIHIGAHKTGTSAIQVRLRQRQAELRDCNWEILLPPNPRGVPANWNHMFQMKGQEYSLKENVLDRLIQQVDRSEKNIILSSEELFFLDESEIINFCQKIRPLFSNITVIVYLRRQDRMMTAHWEQGARTEQSANLFLDTDHPFKNLTPAAYRYLDYANRLSYWKKHLKPLSFIIRNYEVADLYRQDSVSDFLQSTGIALSQRQKEKYVNSGLSSEAVKFIYELRKLGYARPVLKSLINSKLLPHSTTRARAGRVDVVNFMEKFSESNQKLAAMADTDSKGGVNLIRTAFKVKNRSGFFKIDDISKLPEQSEFPEYTWEQKYKTLVRFHAGV